MRLREDPSATPQRRRGDTARRLGARAPGGHPEGRMNDARETPRGRMRNNEERVLPGDTSETLRRLVVDTRKLLAGHPLRVRFRVCPVCPRCLHRDTLRASQGADACIMVPLPGSVWPPDEDVSTRTGPSLRPASGDTGFLGAPPSGARWGGPAGADFRGERAARWTRSGGQMTEHARLSVIRIKLVLASVARGYGCSVASVARGYGAG